MTDKGGIRRTKHGVPVGCCPRDCFGRDVAAAARAIFDNDCLPQDSGKLAGELSAQDVDTSAGRKGIDDRDRPAREGCAATGWSDAPVRNPTIATNDKTHRVVLIDFSRSGFVKLQLKA